MRISQLILTALVALAATAYGADAPVPTPPGRQTTFGTAGLTSYVVPATDLSTFDPGDTWSPVPGGPGRYLTGGPDMAISFVAAVHLPQGASVEMIQIEGCDNSPIGNLNGSLNAAASPSGDGFEIAGFNTGDAETPGCAFFEVQVSPPVTIDNANNLYYWGVENTAFDGSTYFRGLRVFYRLQVSPAPDVPTFTDVPATDPGYQFIEALAASGISAGCGGGNYCPDNPVTRRQMAVFLAKALGLNWPN